MIQDAPHSLTADTVDGDRSYQGVKRLSDTTRLPYWMQPQKKKSQGGVALAKGSSCRGQC